MSWKERAKQIFIVINNRKRPYPPSSLQLRPQHLHPGIVIFPHNPTHNIPDKLNGFKVILPISDNNEQTQYEVIRQEQIQQKQLRGPLEYDLVLVDLKLTEIW